MKHLLTIAALMLSMSSAAQNYEIVPDIEGQTSEYREGKQVTTVTKDGVTLSVTLSKEKNSYGKFYQSGVMLVNASGGSQKNQNQEKFVADIVANEKRKVLCLYDLTIYLQI